MSVYGDDARRHARQSRWSARVALLGALWLAVVESSWISALVFSVVAGGMWLLSEKFEADGEKLDDADERRRRELEAERRADEEESAMVRADAELIARQEQLFATIDALQQRRLRTTSREEKERLSEEIRDKEGELAELGDARLRLVERRFGPVGD